MPSKPGDVCGFLWPWLIVVAVIGPFPVPIRTRDYGSPILLLRGIFPAIRGAIPIWAALRQTLKIGFSGFQAESRCGVNPKPAIGIATLFPFASRLKICHLSRIEHSIPAPSLVHLFTGTGCDFRQCWPCSPPPKNVGTSNVPLAVGLRFS